MFVSLNKKILIGIFSFLIFVAVIFFAIFINLYSQKLQEGQNSIYVRNQYVVDLLYDNINLRKELSSLIEKYPEASQSLKSANIIKKLGATQAELSHEQQLNEELKKNYNNSKEAIKTGALMMLFSLFFIILLIFLLIFLLDYWVISPIAKLTEISKKVSLGIFSSRIKTKKPCLVHDEFDILYNTFNQMLDNTEFNIKEIKNREHFLQRLIDTIPDGIRVIDKNYNVVMANRAFNRLLKIKNSGIGEKCYKAYGYNCEGCSQSKYNCPIQELMSKNDNTFHSIHEIGKTPLYVNASRLNINIDDSDFYIIESFHDLSNDVKFSHQQKVSSLAFLSTSIAHEMKNNLGAIRLIFEGILDNYYKNVRDDDDQKKYLMMAYNQLIETVKTPERLLRLAQYSDNETTDIETDFAIKDMLLMIDYDAKRRGIEIKTNLDKDVLLKGNESDFKMIILNLAQNAIKAMPQGGTLKIDLYKNRNDAIINISDTGIGIEENKIKHIFEPFYSGNDTAKSSGLGLAIVNSLVEKFKGHISVKSRVGKGSTFSIKIPITKK